MHTLLNWLWQGFAVTLALFVMLPWLRRSRANSRYVVCWVGLVLVALLPAVSPLMSGYGADAWRVVSAEAIVSAPDAWWASAAAIATVWAMWAGAGAIRVVRAIVTIRRARACGSPFPPHVESQLPHWMRLRQQGRGAVLVLSESVTTAAVLGAGLPVIAVAPALLEDLARHELDRVLVHEWAHVQRRDDVLHVAQLVVRILVGWHPAVWWIERRLHVEREMACDEIAIAVAGSPKSYAQCLVKLAGIRRARHTMLPAPAIRPAKDLRARVAGALSTRQFLRPVWSWSIVGAVVSTLCIVSLTVGAMRLVEASVLALPLESIDATRIASDPIAHLAVPLLSPRAEVPRPRRVVSGPAVQQAAASAAAAPHRDDVPPPKVAAASAPDGSSRAVEADTTPAAEAESVVPLDATPVEHHALGTEFVRAPMSLGDRSAAIGAKSRDAGVAAARFFTRFGRRVAGSF